MPFGKLQAGCHGPFTEEWLPFCHSTIKAWLVECCRDGCLSGRFAHLHRGTLELCQSEHRVLGHLPDQGPSPPIAQFGRTASSRKSLGGSKLLCLRMMEANPLPRSVPRHNPVSELYGHFLWPHVLVFALTCTVNCGILYRQLCAFPNPVLSIAFTTGGVESSCRNISRMINGNRKHLSSISSLIAKGLNSYENKVFLFFTFH